MGLLLVLFPVQNDQHYDTGEGYAEDARPHADVAVIAGLWRQQSAGGGDFRRLGVIADLAGAGLLPALLGRRLFGDDPIAEGVGFFGHDYLAAARPFLLMFGLGGRPFLLAGVVGRVFIAVLFTAFGACAQSDTGRGATAAAVRRFNRIAALALTGAGVGLAVATGLPITPDVAELAVFTAAFLAGFPRGAGGRFCAARVILTPDVAFFVAAWA